MSFEQAVREKIASNPSKVAKGILKVVLGEFQQKNASGKATDNDGYSIIEKIVNGNKETIGYLKPEDPRVAVMTEENEVVSSLLPPYMSAAEVAVFIGDTPDLLLAVTNAFGNCDNAKPVTDKANAGNIGKITGVVVKACKAANKEVKGDAVKEALTVLFERSINRDGIGQ